MTTLVTGATGHLGANLIRALLGRGERVRVLVRRTSSLAALDGLDVELAYGELRDGASLRAAAKGCDRIYHLAAMVSLRRADLQDLYDVNVLGTRKLLDAARAEGVARVMHCSSFGAVGRNPNGASDERWTVNPFDTHLDYECTKAFAEHEVLRAVLGGLDVVMVNPSGMVGPWDFAPSAFGQAVLDFANGRMKAYVEGSFAFVTMRDAVAGCLAAMERGRAGERYILSSDHHSLREILTWISELSGAPAPRFAVPLGLMKVLAVVKDPVEARFFPKNAPRFTAQTIRLLNSGKRADASRMPADLGVEPTSVRDALAEQIEWFRERGWIR
ncbi:MAG: SDR family oxidoreductase [Myxococcales bacterium]|nr:SDR family oxidoreductase [Myxococcales bacterium]